MQNLQSLGTKGNAFLFLSLLILVGGILCCIQSVGFSYAVAILGILDGLIGLYSGWTRNVKGLLLFFGITCFNAVLALIDIFILVLGYRLFNIPPYVGLLILLILGPIAAWLAYDGRGKTLGWNTGGTSSESPPQTSPQQT